MKIVCREWEREEEEERDTFLSAKLEQKKKKKKENPIEERYETRLVKHILRISIYFIYKTQRIIIIIRKDKQQIK